MKITIESTDKVIELIGDHGRMPARVWEGATEKGVPVFCFVTRIAPSIKALADGDARLAEFERDLEECRPASPAVKAFDPRLIL